MIFHVPEALAQEFPCFLICQVTNTIDLHPGPQAAFPDRKKKGCEGLALILPLSITPAAFVHCNRVLFLLDHFYKTRYFHKDFQIKTFGE